MTVKWNSHSFQVKEIFPRVLDKGARGITWREIQQDFDSETEAHHGSISGSLSFLNQAKRIVGLKEQRDNCRVYVHPNYVFGREVVPPRKNGLTKDEVAYYRTLEAFMLHWFEVDETDSRTGVKATCRAEQFKGLFVRDLKTMWADRPVIEP